MVLQRLLLGVGLLCAPVASGAQQPQATSPGGLLVTDLSRYRAEIVRYRSGDVAAAVSEIRSWDARSFRDLREAILQQRERLATPTSDRRTWTIREVEAAAVLHTEAALASPSFSREEVSHLNWARELLRLLDGLPADDELHRQWYGVVGAHYQSELRLREAAELLREAVGRWGTDARLLTMAGTVYDVLSRRSATFQRLLNQLVRLVPGDQDPDEERSRQLAVGYLRRALDADQSLAEARMRLGRLELDAGRSHDSISTLERALSAAKTPRERYLSALLLGRALQRERRLDEAVTRYRQAATAAPGCPVALLAVAHVEASQSGSAFPDVAETQSSANCEDPWWLYDFGSGPAPAELLERLRRKLSS